MADPLYRGFGNPSLDVLHYRLALAWVPQRRALTGTATLTIRAVKPVSEVALDFSGTYQIMGLTFNGVAVKPKRRGDRLVVALPQTLEADVRATLVVRYRGTPRPVSIPGWSGWTGDGMGLRAMANGEAWSIQQPVGAFTWYPVNDHPSDEALYDIAVTVPKGWTGIATGTLVSTKHQGSTSTFGWRSADPVASYATTLVLGRYTRLAEKGPGGVPVSLWLRKGRDEGRKALLRKVPGLLSWLAKRYGPYPFPAAGVVLVDSGSAMETQQLITMGAGSSGGSQLLLHELSHEWFGNAVTPRDWRSIWLSEGFATYVEGEWLIDQGGASRAGIVAGWRAEDSAARSAAGPPGKPSASHFGERNVYASPALLLHEIRKTIGARAFDALVRDWVQDQRNQSADRETFTAFVNRHAGRDLTALINRWLDSRNTPPAS